MNRETVDTLQSGRCFYKERTLFLFAPGKSKYRCVILKKNFGFQMLVQ